MPDDAQLLRQYLDEGSEAAFSELVRQHLGLVYHAALRQLGGDAHGAQDVAQAVFILLARRAPALRRHPSLAGWLYAAAHFKVAEAIRAAQRRRAHEREALAMEENLHAPGPPIDWSVLRPVLDQLVMQLGRLDREAVLLRYFEKLPFAEIGLRFGLGEDAAQKRVERALERLRRRLARREITSTSAALAALLSSETELPTPAGLAGSITGLALASGHGLSAFGLIQLMSTTKLTGGALGAMAVAALLSLSSIGFGVYELRRSLHNHQALRVAGRQYEVERTQLETLGRKAEPIPLPAASAAATPAIGRPGPTLAGTDTPKVARSAAEARMDAQRFLATFPEAHDLLLSVGKSSLERSYRAFFQEAGLTTAQIEEWENRTLQYSEENLAVSPENGLQSTVTQLPDSELRGIFGDQGCQQFEDYIRMMSANGLAREATAATAMAADPLSPDQGRQLAQVIANNSAAYQSGGRLNPDAVDWASVGTQAQALMSADQWKVAQGVFLNRQYRQAYAQAVQNAASAAPSGEK